MKNIKMALKIGMGFGLVVLIMIVLSCMAIRTMKEQRDGAASVTRIYMPELVLGVKIERAASGAMAAMLRYIQSEDPAYVNTAKKALGEIQDQAAEAAKLIEQYPQLTVLKAKLDTAKPVIDTYTEQVNKTVQALESLKKQRSELAGSADIYMNAVKKMSVDQEMRLDKCVAENAADEIVRRLGNVRRLNALRELGEAIRLSNFQSQVMQDPAIAEQGIKNFDLVYEALTALDASIKRADAREQLRRIKDASAAYQAGLRKLVDDWKSIQRLNVQRNENSIKLLDNAQHVARASVQQVEDLCRAAGVASSAGVTVLTTGMIVGLLLSCALAWLLARVITGPLRKSVDFATAVADGELDKKLDIQQRDEVGQLADALNIMVGTLRQRIADADEASKKASAKEQEALNAMREAEQARKQAEQAKRQGMLAAAGQLEDVVANVSSASEQLASQVSLSEKGSQQQSVRVGETAAAMEEMNSTVLEVARNAGDTASVSEQAKQKAQAGADIVQQVIGGMERISKGSESLQSDMDELGRKAASIGTIMDVISDIADQTNLLALNAAIEAARAGEAGRGFAVVADEVRKLAEKTMKATAEVGDAIRGIQQGTAKNIENVQTSIVMVTEVTELASRSGQALGEIVKLVDQASDQVRAIATASEEQSSTSEEINRAVEDINQISTETAEAMRLANQAVQELSRQASVLDNLIQDMKRS